VVERRILWWLLPMILLTLFLSWGKNLMWLTDIFVDYVPLYNKFRTVSMMLVATGFGITLVAILALKEILTSENRTELIRPMLISAGITGGIALVFALIPSLAGSFVSPADAQFTGDYAFLKETLPLDREAMLRADAWRSVAFIVATAVLLWLFLKSKIKTSLAIAAMGILFLADLVPVAKRYLNDDNFTRKRKFETLIEPSAADNMILTDKTQYRVLDATVNIFSDSKPSYFHKNIGGYHAAKLRRYQELINMQLEGEVGQLFAAFSRAKTFEEIKPVFDSLGVLNMLNMKYVIYNKDAAPLINSANNGNAWFVDEVIVAANANEEMKVLGEINTKKQLVVDKEFAAQIPATLIKDSTSSIALKSYKPNHLIYSVNAASDKVAVFSEIYYEKGWNAYINGEKVPYIRANYLLRAMPLKKGQYELEFKFEPVSYSLGNTLALSSSIVLIICLLAFAFFTYRKKKAE
jgi:cbb3-type cytochrome oxidase subunit 3